MRLIAFKRAGKQQEYLHPDTVVEFIDSVHLQSTDGYETLLEDDFNKELAKNEERKKEHLKAMKDLEVAKIKAREAAQVAEIAEQKQLEREFEQFRQWKLNKSKDKK